MAHLQMGQAQLGIHRAEEEVTTLRNNWVRRNNGIQINGSHCYYNSGRKRKTLIQIQKCNRPNGALSVTVNERKN